MDFKCCDLGCRMLGIVPYVSGGDSGPCLGIIYYAVLKVCLATLVHMGAYEPP